MSNTHINITINDPARWYLKYTEKSKHYVQLHSSFWGDSEFVMLNNDEKILFLWILSQSLRVNKPSLSICLDFACGILNIPLDTSKGILNSLKKNNFIDLDRNLRSQLIEQKKRKEKKSKIEKKDFSKSKSNTPPLIEEILDIWNRNAPDFGFPKVSKLNPSRLKKLQKAIKDYDKPDDWIKIFSSASRKGFTGKDGRDFVPNWDYVFRNENWIKFHEEYEVLFAEKVQSEEELTAQVEAQLKEQLGF